MLRTLIEQLRPHFRLVALSDEAWIDDASEDLFETITKIAETKNVKDIVDRSTNLSGCDLLPQLGHEPLDGDGGPICV